MPLEKRQGVPGPSESPKRVAIFGAGIAGLTAAYGLVKLGYQISIYEANCTLGGFFRSARLPDDDNMPSEYSWHGFGPCYHNAFDLFGEIPFDETGCLYYLALSRPIDFGIFPEHGEAAFYDWGVLSIPKMFRLSWWEFLKATRLMPKIWAANLRTEESCNMPGQTPPSSGSPSSASCR